MLKYDPIKKLNGMISKIPARHITTGPNKSRALVA